MTGRKCPDLPASRVEGHGTRGPSVLPGRSTSPAPPRGLCLPLLDAEAPALLGEGKVSLEAEESAEVLADSSPEPVPGLRVALGSRKHGTIKGVGRLQLAQKLQEWVLWTREDELEGRHPPGDRGESKQFRGPWRVRTWGGGGVCA